MGFDVLYLPPIHPIGTTHRKGPNNVTTARADRPGEPVGDRRGRPAVTRPCTPTSGPSRTSNGSWPRPARIDIDVALDLAFQTSPDHPWVTEHPQWFRHRPDGTIAYAENPPKRYEDIYPIDFTTEDATGLWNALLDVVRFWIERGVRVFRVDNPHTKPFEFWEWLIASVHATDPDVIFLAEAFTRPRVMERLAKIGFTQSYTYFTWRNEKWEIEEYFRELSDPAHLDYFRPNVWPNTPDILHETLQEGTRATFIVRFLLAAGLSANYGIYGPVFELQERTAREAGSEEYLDSEKYEVRHWDLDRPDSLRHLIGLVNAVRRAHPALQRDDTLRFHGVDNDRIVCWSKRGDARRRHRRRRAVRGQPRSGAHAVGLDRARPARPRLRSRRAHRRPRPAHRESLRLGRAAQLRRARPRDRARARVLGHGSAGVSTWYEDAVIYELHVRAFADSDGDGIGDFVGLTQRLDYLQDLGVTAIWLLPFYPSPMRDEGYDISDYRGINPAYGTLRQFRRFLDEAHKRGLKVITEIVLNHTSDQHPWFQRARRAPIGSRYRDWYVWSDNADRYKDARIIFRDFEPSNWTWDPVAGQYYWHRFYASQPDLNYDNPEVRREMLRTVEYWLDLGVDGLRLDAVPYLIERDGTSCENLPETHEYLKELRRHVDARFDDRMLLAEANQWPEDAIAYFGNGDECHMAFHFPLMPRLFMGLRMEDRFPIIDILRQTPAIPDKTQWAVFLRNHDELTLEMVTDEERDYMYRAYAHEPVMRINLGIRRRLAPLLHNNRQKMELMHGLLCSLPGTPVLYYGDEIGMGDNVYLGDRDGVRTPMQWSADRNAGFSTANPQKLFMPVIIDPEYNYETVNVAAQLDNPESLLWWVRRLIALRKRYPVFGHGSIELLSPDNYRVLAFLRRDGGQLE